MTSLYTNSLFVFQHWRHIKLLLDDLGLCAYHWAKHMVKTTTPIDIVALSALRFGTDVSKNRNRTEKRNYSRTVRIIRFSVRLILPTAIIHLINTYKHQNYTFQALIILIQPGDQPKTNYGQSLVTYSGHVLHLLPADQQYDLPTFQSN